MRAKFLLAGVVSMSFAAVGLAQNQPSPGPTNPVPPDPQSKSGATIVVNPTEEE